ncbi:MAG: hypothetical protein JWP04_848 [Belnapia sp.]|nr:hypothetical protein [Belnapia sp.]
MAGDPLRSLARLRRLETTEAKRRLGEAFGRLAAADQRVVEAAAALVRETAGAAPDDYATWLRRGLAERDRAALARGLAQSGTAAAQDLLAEARAAERGLETLRQARAKLAARLALRQAQAALDEAASRRPARPA